MQLKLVFSRDFFLTIKRTLLGSIYVFIVLNVKWGIYLDL